MRKVNRTFCVPAAQFNNNRTQSFLSIFIQDTGLEGLEKDVSAQDAWQGRTFKELYWITHSSPAFLTLECEVSDVDVG